MLSESYDRLPPPTFCFFFYIAYEIEQILLRILCWPTTASMSMRSRRRCAAE